MNYDMKDYVSAKFRILHTARRCNRNGSIHFTCSGWSCTMNKSHLIASYIPKTTAAMKFCTHIGVEHYYHEYINSSKITSRNIDVSVKSFSAAPMMHAVTPLPWWGNSMLRISTCRLIVRFTFPMRRVERNPLKDLNRQAHAAV